MHFVKSLAAAVAVSTSGIFAAVTPREVPSLLIFTKTLGYRHTSIPHGIDLVNSIAIERGWSVATSENSSIFTEEGLRPYTTLVFISTTGNFLSVNESNGLNDFLLRGGSWLGIHAAADFGDDMPAWYSKLVGGQFLSHPCETVENCDEANRARYPPGGNVRPDIVQIQTHDHPSTINLPATYNRTDEWYAYKTNVADFPSNYTVLATLAETYIDDITISPELEHMDPHPISWYSMYEGKARAFYTGQGHTNETYYDPYFITHVTGGLEWVTGVSN